MIASIGVSAPVYSTLPARLCLDGLAEHAFWRCRPCSLCTPGSGRTVRLTIFLRIPVASATCSGAGRPPVPDPASPSSEPRRRHPSPVAALRVPGARRPGPGRSCGSRSERTLDADEHSWMMARTTGQPADRPGMSGRLRPESVADSVRNRWPGGVGIRSSGGRAQARPCHPLLSDSAQCAFAPSSRCAQRKPTWISKSSGSLASRYTD